MVTCKCHDHFIRDMDISLCLIYFLFKGIHVSLKYLFMKQEIAQQLQEMVRNVKRSHIFFITDCENERDHAIKICRENRICPVKHVFSPESDKSPLYKKMYEILENQITNLLSDLNSRASTRLVRTLILELEELCRKLNSRKKKPKRSLTKQCIELIKEYVHFIPTATATNYMSIIITRLIKIPSLFYFILFSLQCL